MIVSAPLDRSLLPRAASVDARGRLSIGGCDLADLAAQHGTPLFVYDESELRARAREYLAAFGDGVAYAGKAFLCLAMARLVDEEGLHLDVATGGELHVALVAGFPPDRIVFHGNNKSTDELSRALEAGVGRVVVDSFDELDRVEALVASGLPAPALQVRVTPGVEAHTHEHIETGTDDSKFGFGVGGGDALRAVRRVADAPWARLAGLHCHIGSQVVRLDAFELALGRMADIVHSVAAEAATPVDELNIGGGLGIRYVAHDTAPTIAQYADAVHAALERAFASGAARPPRVMVEPGRSIAGPAAVTVYRVGTIKRAAGGRTYVAVDGGMSDNLRPVAYGARYEAFLPGRVADARPLTATVAGKHCEQGDVVVRDADLPADVAVGDLLATPCTGAYGLSMASNYNKVQRPAVVFVREGSARVVIRRETLDDLVARDS